MDLMLTLHGVPDMQLGSNQGHLKKGKERVSGTSVVVQ